MQQFSSLLARLPEPLVHVVERGLAKIPGARRRIEGLYDEIVEGLDESVHPYKHTLPALKRLPTVGRPRDGILAEMEELQAHEGMRWQSGYVSGAVYQGDPEHVAFLNRVYAINAQSNPLHFDLWPSTVKYEAEIVSMTAHMLGADRTEDPVVGTVTSGGTESILLAMRTYRDWARTARGVKHPELVVPTTAHAAFDKAAQSFGIELRARARGAGLPGQLDRGGHCHQPQHHRPGRFRAVISARGDRPDCRVSSVGGQPRHWVARRCLSWRFHLALGRASGLPVPAFDFRLKGVTSMSADTHKYGYAAKGTSVILYRGEELRRIQYYAVADWPGGLYFSPHWPAAGRVGLAPRVGQRW